MLQPLAENAVRHGLWPQAAAGELLIQTRRADGWLRVVIEDDGRGLPAPGERRPPTSSGDGGTGGIGLANTRARLLRLYGTRHRFDVAPRAGGGVTVILEVPFRTRPPAVGARNAETVLTGAA